MNYQIKFIIKKKIKFKPKIIPIAPLSRDRKEYLYKNIRQHVEKTFIFLNFKINF